MTAAHQTTGLLALERLRQYIGHQTTALALVAVWVLHGRGLVQNHPFVDGCNDLAK